MSETAASRSILAPFCVGLGIDCGFGGDAVVPHALTMDMPQPYTKVGGDKQILRGTAENLSGFCDGSLDFIYSSHLLEDWTYIDLVDIIREWRRVLRVGGRTITNCPTQAKFLAHCASTGQPGNDAHKEADFGLETFRSHVLDKTGPWKEIFVEPNFGPYSFLLVCEKV